MHLPVVITTIALLKEIKEFLPQLRQSTILEDYQILSRKKSKSKSMWTILHETKWKSSQVISLQAWPAIQTHLTPQHKLRTPTLVWVAALVSLKLGNKTPLITIMLLLYNPALLYQAEAILNTNKLTLVIAIHLLSTRGMFNLTFNIKLNLLKDKLKLRHQLHHLWIKR